MKPLLEVAYTIWPNDGENSYKYVVQTGDFPELLLLQYIEKTVVKAEITMAAPEVALLLVALTRWLENTKEK